jgi:zinc protease
VLEIYKERFADAGDFTFVFTGSFTPEELKLLAEQYLGSLPSFGKSEQFKALGIDVPKCSISKSIYAGKEDKATVLMVFHGNYQSSPELNTKLTALKNVIQFRMTERLRENEGGAYSPSVSFQSEAGEQKGLDKYSFVVNFGCAPANADKLIAAVMDELSKLKQSGTKPGDLQKIHAEEQRLLESSLQDNGFWLNYLVSKYQNGGDLKSILKQSELIKNLTDEDVKAVAKKYIDPENLLKFVWLPVRQ